MTKKPNWDTTDVEISFCANCEEDIDIEHGNTCPICGNYLSPESFEMYYADNVKLSWDS